MNRGERDLVYLRNPCTTNLSLHPAVFYHDTFFFFLLIHHAYVSDDATTPKLPLTPFPLYPPPLCISASNPPPHPHSVPLYTFIHPSCISLTPTLTRNTRHLVPICPCALCKEVAALSRGAPAPLLPAHAPRHPAREAKAQSLIW